MAERKHRAVNSIRPPQRGCRATLHSVAIFPHMDLAIRGGRVAA